MADQHPTTLLTILTNQLLLLLTVPYLSVGDIHSLTLTSRALYNSITSSPSVHRYLDLSARPTTRSQKHTKLPRLLTTTPHHRILHATRTLILDNTPTTDTDLRTLIAPQDRPSTIQLLSIRDCESINHYGLMALLTSLVTSYSANELSLKGVYWFTSPTFTSSTGRIVRNNRLRLIPAWVPVLQACAGRITFDTVVCDGHSHSGDRAVTAQLANIRLGDSGSGCGGCGAVPARSKALVAPAPRFGGFNAACRGAEGVLRCEECVKERWCECCGVWWCEACAEGEKKMKRTCFECGSQCVECTAKHSRVCLSCKGGYCITHNEGAEESYCEWCVAANVPRRGSASSSSSNAFLTSPAKAYYLSLGPAQHSTAKPRTVSSGTPFRAATNVPIGGRQYQKEIAATTRRVGMQL
ncbi:uncharacterized protein LAJ45_09573 [Morchella importuna]|uniref:uncharacterized protein n=1 Tax=Morchella importuna TaxID=1174673 RepID=UPI001E8DACFA|nr:uncharacterized protein LAJ45_09573 [Morchella importuna]KAH8146380.1 hypothetical protein LAJ45_09573 [Morchella importuna]